MLTNSLYNYGGGCGGCNDCGYNRSNCGGGYDYGCGCNNGCNNGCGISNYGTNLGNTAYCFIGEWVNIVVTLTILQSILGLICNWNCGGTTTPVA